MSLLTFKGFGGVRLEAEVVGSVDEPAILLVHGAGQTRDAWRKVAESLVGAGRRVINLDLRGHGASEWPADGRYDIDAYVEDLRYVLAALGERPVIVAATLGGWIATLALERDGALLASGLVLVDMPVRLDRQEAERVADALRRREHRVGGGAFDARTLGLGDMDALEARIEAAAAAITMPTLVLRGALSRLDAARDSEAFTARLVSGEYAEVDDASFVALDDRMEAFNGLLLEFLERRQPRGPIEFRAGADQRTLRDALGCFATGVTVVTAIAPGGAPVGLTANSFTSLSLDPPLLLVCIANSSGNARALREAEHFGLNVLHIGQQPVSQRFAGRGEDRFAHTAWGQGETGVPILTGALSAFECRRYAVHEGGDHFILVGQVLRAQFEPRRDPLLYFRGKYRRLHFA